MLLLLLFLCLASPSLRGGNTDLDVESLVGSHRLVSVFMRLTPPPPPHPALERDLLAQCGNEKVALGI